MLVSGRVAVMLSRLLMEVDLLQDDVAALLVHRLQSDHVLELALLLGLYHFEILSHNRIRLGLAAAVLVSELIIGGGGVNRSFIHILLVILENVKLILGPVLRHSFQQQILAFLFLVRVTQQLVVPHSFALLSENLLIRPLVGKPFTFSFWLSCIWTLLGNRLNDRDWFSLVCQPGGGETPLRFFFEVLAIVLPIQNDAFSSTGSITSLVVTSVAKAVQNMVTALLTQLQIRVPLFN